MMKFLFGGAAAIAFVAAPSALAQPAPPPPPGVAQGTAPIPMLPPQKGVHVIRLMEAGTRDEVVAHVREMFAKLDSNKDGFVTREEASAAHKAMIGEFRTKSDKRFVASDFPHPDRGAMFDKLDTNRDGMISRQEFMSAKSEMHERHVVMRDGPRHVRGTPEGPTRVTILQDGAEPVEVSSRPGEPGMKVMRMHRMAMHGRMFEDSDANRDGKVSLDEMTATALRHFDAVDANHDGRLSPDERAKIHPRIMTQRVRVQPS